MKIAALQYDMAWEDPEANFPRLETWIAGAAGLGARLVVLPEMFACGFSMNTSRIAEPVDGPSTRFLVDTATKHKLWLAGSLPEKSSDADRPTNTLVLAGPDGQIHRYHKIHPFTYADEHLHYEAGTDFVHVEVEGLRITLFVCYDLRFADEFWATAEKTDAYVVVANWPETRRAHWTTLLTARAIENQAWVVGVNRVGKGGKLVYSGDSRIIDPMGQVVAAAADQETLLIADVDPQRTREVREQLPFLQDRRRS